MIEKIHQQIPTHDSFEGELSRSKSRGEPQGFNEGEKSKGQTPSKEKGQLQKKAS